MKKQTVYEELLFKPFLKNLFNLILSKYQNWQTPMQTQRGTIARCLDTEEEKEGVARQFGAVR